MTSDRAGGLVLLVDDDPRVLAMLRLMLARVPGLRTVQAAGGREAVARIAADPPDLVLTDVDMPELDGLALARAVRTDPRTRALPVLAMSGNPVNRAPALAAGCAAFLAKPFGVAEARDLIGRWLPPAADERGPDHAAAAGSSDVVPVGLGVAA